VELSQLTSKLTEQNHAQLRYRHYLRLSPTTADVIRHNVSTIGFGVEVFSCLRPIQLFVTSWTTWSGASSQHNISREVLWNENLSSRWVGSKTGCWSSGWLVSPPESNDVSERRQ